MTYPTYEIIGIASHDVPDGPGGQFTVGPRNGFESYQEARDYAVEYARCVTGTDRVHVLSEYVIASGEDYAELLRIVER